METQHIKHWSRERIQSVYLVVGYCCIYVCWDSNSSRELQRGSHHCQTLTIHKDELVNHRYIPILIIKEI